MKETETDSTKVDLPSASTTAENLTAWKELLSSPEAKEFVNSTIEKCVVLFGQTRSQKLVLTASNILLMVTAFGCIGILGHHSLLSDGTIGVLAGIIIGYFFKKSE